jgi:hypothetical protein
VENPLKSNEIKSKIKMTCLKKYGVKNTSQLPENRQKAKNTCLKKYGNKNYNNTLKNKQTCLKKYGVEHPLQSNKIKQKIKQTCLKKYGVEHISQSEIIHKKQQKSALKIKQYLTTKLHYQGTYELDFLDKFYNDNIENGPTIKYIFENKEKVYFPDFYIKSKNLIVEIKSEYIYNKHLKQNLAKQKACIDQGYDFLFIINKNYNELNEKIKEK